MTTPSYFWTEPHWVSKDIICQEFNQSQIYERVKRRELRKQVWGYDNHLKRHQREKVQEPRCTRSQMVLYSTLNGEPLALVHQYKRRNGDIGGTGRPEPKRLFTSGRIIAVRQSP